MKPRFSMLTLLAATAYLALVFAGLKEPLGWWRSAGTMAWLLVLAYLIAMAMDARHRPSAIFGRSAVGCILAYGLLTWLPIPLAAGMEAPRYVPFRTAPERIDVLPHQWFALWWADESAANPSRLTAPLQTPYTSQMQAVSVWQLPQTKAVEVIAALNCSLAFGLFGGSLALWRCRALEQRRKRCG